LLLLSSAERTAEEGRGGALRKNRTPPSLLPEREREREWGGGGNGDRGDSLMQETVGHAPSSSASVAATLFDSRKVAKPDADDPFGEAASAVLKDMKKGMEDLLSMMNLHELASLCGALGLPNAGPHVERQARVLGYIRAGGRQSAEKRFAQVLRLTWEGLLFEYLRYVGHPLHSARTDPRLAVLRYWRRSTLAPGGAGANFVPYYLERQIKARSAITKLDPDIERIRVTLGEHETSVKLTEGKIRKDNDYRHVLDLMAANKRLHKYALESVEYLSRELETSRAQLDHSMETAAMLEENVVEIEQTLNDAMVKSEAAQAEKKAQADRAHAALAQVQASSAVAISTVKAILDDDMEGQGGEPELDSLQTSLAALRGAHLNIVQRHQEECTRLREAMLSLKDETDQAKSEAEATRAQLTAARAEAFVWKEGVETLSRRLDNQVCTASTFLY
jgi:hypothetical protein